MLQIQTLHVDVASFKPRQSIMDSPRSQTSVLIQPSSATIADSSKNTFSLTTNANTIVNPLWSGYYAIRADNNPSKKYVAGPSSTEFVLGTSDFTVDAILKITGGSYQSTGHSARILGCENGGVDNWYIDLATSGNGGTPNGFSFWATNQSNHNANFTFSIGQTYHVAATRSGGFINLYVNGTRILRESDVVNYSNNTPLRCLSRGDHYDAGLRADVYMMRIVKGKALWTEASFASTYNKPVLMY